MLSLFRTSTRILISILFMSELAFSIKEWWEDSKVVELNNDNFHQIVGKDKYVVVKFYTKWCYYCRQMAPEYEKVFDYYQNEKKRDDLIIARIEGSENDDIALQYGIFSFPRILLIGPGDPRIKEVFERPRLFRFMVDWIEAEAPAQKPKEEGKKLFEEIKNEGYQATASDSQHVVKLQPIDEKHNPNNDLGSEKLTSEIEFVKRDNLALKARIESLEEALKQLKNDLNKTNESLTTLSAHKPSEALAPSTSSLVVVLIFVVILIAAGLTIKRIYLSNNGGDNMHHMKV